MSPHPHVVESTPEDTGRAAADVILRAAGFRERQPDAPSGDLVRVAAALERIATTLDAWERRTR